MARRKPHQRESDLELINKLYIQGWSQQSISDEIARIRDYTVSQQSISNDLDEIQKRWLENTTLDLDDYKAKELARIDELEREYWSQYEASKEDKETTTKNIRPTDRTDAQGNPINQYGVSTRTETRTGNPAYLQGVERCIKMRMDLLGLEAPKRTEVTGDLKHEVTRKVSAEDLSDDDLASILAGLKASSSE